MAFETLGGMVAYPRSYTASKGWKLGFGLLAVVMGIGGLLGVWYFGTGHEVGSSQERLMMVAISLGLGVLGLLGAWSIVFGTILTLTRNELKVPGLWGTKTLARHHIKGYRVVAAQGFNMLVIEPLAKAQAMKTIKLAMLFKPDAAFDAWFLDVPNLDAVELDHSVQRVAKDVRLGDSLPERLDTARRARAVSRALVLVTYAVTAWAIFYPRPYAAAIVAVAVLPVVALALCLGCAGWFSVDDSGRNTVRGDLTVLLIAPGMALALRALMDVNLLDATQMWVPSLAALVMMLGCCAWVAPVYRQRLDKFLLVALVLSAYAGGGVALANVMLDHAPAKPYKVQVLDKRTDSGKFPSAYLGLSAWGSMNGPHELRVPWNAYHRTSIGEPACVFHHRGALGVAWYEVFPGLAC